MTASQVRGDSAVPAPPPPAPPPPAPSPPARLPKYYGVKRQLLELTRALAPGTALAPERELATRYGTSRTTIRQALAELAVEGRLLRIQGRGTFVAKPKVARVLELTSYTDDMRARGLDPQSVILDTRYVAAERELAGRLGIRPGARVLHFRRLRLADSEPMSVDSTYLAARRFPGLRRHLRRNPSLYGTLAAQYGTELAEAQETIETVLAGPQDASLLGVDVGFPLLLTSRHSFDADGSPVEWAQSWYRGDRYKLITRLRRPGP